MFRLVTLNIFQHLHRWHERRGLLVAGLAQCQADVIALQEVSLPYGTGTWLQDQLAQTGLSYRAYFCPNGPRRHEALALFSRWPVEVVDQLDLQTDFCMAQWAVVRLPGQPVLVCNGHYYWWPTDTYARRAQIKHVLAWLATAPTTLPQVVCGDFNAGPNTRSIRLMKKQFASAHAARHGAEPPYTCPTSTLLGHWARSPNRLVRTVLHRSLVAIRRTVDYIFVRPTTHVRDCRVVLNHPSPTDPTLFPSDHFGLLAELEFP